MIGEKDFMDRIVELVRDDKELHDAAVRLIDSLARMNDAKAELLRKKAQR